MAFLDEVNSITRKTIVPGGVDQVFKSGPTMAYLRRNCLAKYQGGPSWQENFVYDMQSVTAYNPGDVFDYSTSQFFTGGTVTPRYYNVPVAALIEKVKLTLAGPEAVFNYIDTLLQNAAMTMSAKLAIDIFRHGQAATTGISVGREKFINGLDEALCEGVTAGPFGNYYTSYLTLTRNDANIGTALNSHKLAATGYVNGNVGGPISYPVLEQAYNSCVYGTESPDLLITTNKGMSLIKLAFHAQQRYEGTSADFGFQGIKFNGATIFQDRYAPGSDVVSAPEANKLGRGTSGSAEISAETLYFLNTKYIRFYVSTDKLFGFGFTGFLPSQDTSTVVGHYKFAGNLTVQAPRFQRVLWGIS